jgi:hypothetical protein
MKTMSVPWPFWRCAFATVRPWPISIVRKKQKTAACAVICTNRTSRNLERRPLVDNRWVQFILRLGFVAILLGYFLVWLPQPAAGLSFIGLEMGEWVKFLPAMESGGASGRNVFYLPPITLGWMMALSTTGWPNRRWQTWAMRGLAFLVALLAFPSIESLLTESPNQWMIRLLMVGSVLLAIILSSVWSRLPFGKKDDSSWSVILVVALLGALLPTWVYLALRPLVDPIIGQEVGIGVGAWLNLAGHLTVGLAALAVLSRRPAKQSAVA